MARISAHYVFTVETFLRQVNLKLLQREHHAHFMLPSKLFQIVFSTNSSIDFYPEQHYSNVT